MSLASTPKSIEIQPTPDTESGVITEWVLLIDGGQEGIYTSQAGAKAGARRFIHSTERLEWNGNQASISYKRPRRTAW